MDYDFTEFNNNPVYLIGMSVPPVMTAQIATEVFTQWLHRSQRGEKKNILNSFYFSYSQLLFIILHYY